MGFVWVGQGLPGSKCTQDGVTVLLELCMRFEQLDSVDSSRDRIALRDLLECPRIIILVLVLIFCFFMFIIFNLVLVLTIVNIVSIFISSVKRAQLPSNCSCMPLSWLTRAAPNSGDSRPDGVVQSLLLHTPPALGRLLGVAVAAAGPRHRQVLCGLRLVRSPDVIHPAWKQPPSPIVPEDLGRALQ